MSEDTCKPRPDRGSREERATHVELAEVLAGEKGIAGVGFQLRHASGFCSVSHGCPEDWKP